MSSETPEQWSQPSLIPPAVVVITLKVGIVYSADLVQMELEERSSTDGVLLGLQSVPARRMSNWEHEFKRLCREMGNAITANTGPFI